MQYSRRCGSCVDCILCNYCFQARPQFIDPSVRSLQQSLEPSYVRHSFMQWSCLLVERRQPHGSHPIEAAQVYSTSSETRKMIVLQHITAAHENNPDSRPCSSPPPLIANQRMQLSCVLFVLWFRRFFYCKAESKQICHAYLLRM